LPYVQTERHRKSFHFSSSQLWNSLPSEVRLSPSLSSFKDNVSKHLKFPTRNHVNYLFYTGDSVASIFHSPLRLNFSALNYDLFKRNCSASSVCAVHQLKMLNYFLFCSSFSALCETLFSSAAHLLGDKWLLASDKKRIGFLLNGVPGLDFQIIVNLFSWFSLLSLNQIVFLNYVLFVCLTFPSVTINNSM